MGYKNKSTVTLWNVSGGKSAGPILLFKKAICELKILKKKKPKYLHKPVVLDGDSNISISVIVCTLNREKKLMNALNSLIDQTLEKSDYEIIVVNNGEPFSAKSQIFRLNHIRIIEERKKGLSFARNTGVDFSRGKYLVFIDDDAIATPGLLKTIKQTFHSHENAGIIGGQVILKIDEPRPEIILSGREALWSQYTVPYKRYREISKQYEFPFGANFSIRRNILMMLGGFDEEYGRTGDDYAGGEETALCFKMLDIGYKIGIEPNAIVYHDVDKSRYTKEHVLETIKAGIFTTYRLCSDGYSPYVWDKSYILSRIDIANKELNRLSRNKASEFELYYKECERDGFVELYESISE